MKAKSGNFIETRGLIEWLQIALQCARRETSSLAEMTSVKGRVDESVSAKRSWKSEMKDETWEAFVRNGLGQSRITWALLPPKPNEFIPTRREAFAGHDISCFGTRTLDVAKSTTCYCQHVAPSPNGLL